MTVEKLIEYLEKLLKIFEKKYRNLLQNGARWVESLCNQLRDFAWFIKILQETQRFSKVAANVQDRLEDWGTAVNRFEIGALNKRSGVRVP